MKTDEASKRTQSPTKAGWRVAEWAADTGLSRSFTYQLLAAGKLAAVKIGTARVITTSPAAYLEAQRRA